MLASLTIKNVVLIDQMTVHFDSGLCALTGETGAGKSILLDSLGLALGSRSDAKLVRHGTDQASVTAEFNIAPEHQIFEFLKEQDLETEAPLILRRTVGVDGRSRAFVNDQAVSVNMLKNIGEFLVEIHGQFDTHKLLNAGYHIMLVDEYADHKQALKKLSAQWHEWKNAQEKLITEQSRIETARADEEYYRSALEDLDKLDPKAGEEETLSALRTKLMRREKIIDSLNSAKLGLQDIESATATVWRAIDGISDDAPKVLEAMDKVDAELQEVASSLDDLAYEVDNSEYLSEIDDRLFALKAQARKHSCEIDALSAKREEIAQALNDIEHQDHLLADLIKAVEAYKRSYQKQAEDISKARQKASAKLEKLIALELPPLKLEKARFEVSVAQLPEEQWNERGMDAVKFLVSTNTNTPAGDLSKIASGGEMSRFMLALKLVLSEVGSAGSLVFDEVDSGIGGATAAAVGQRLARLAERAQLLVVTHSPQVAAMAKNQWIVAKGGDDVVKTNIIQLSKIEQRREEIARMLAGAEITEEARAAANKLLEAGAA